MRSKLTLCLVLFLASAAFGKDPKAYLTGKVVQMDSVSCGLVEKDSQSLTGEMLGTNSGHKKTQQVLCPEYVVETERVIFRIRPRDEKRPELLPIGEQAQFRLQRDKMLLMVEGFDSREREYTVVSMAPRTDASTADASPLHITHLQ